MAKIGNVGRLLDESLQSYYWLGFILADGGFSNNFKRLKIGLGNEDQGHLKTFVEYLDKEYKTKHSASFMDSKILPEIANKLGLDNQTPKTYCQPNLSCYKILEDDKFLALFIGFIDGDGSIQYQTNRDTVKITIKLHSTWLEILDYMVNRTFIIFEKEFKSESIIDNRGFAKVSFGNFKLIKDLKLFIEKNNIRVLDRKWDKIDLELETQDEILQNSYFKIKSLLEYNVPLIVISDVLNLDISMVKRISAKNYRGELNG